MRIHVLFFGLAHDATGFAEEEVEISEGAKLAALWRQYENRFPKLTGVSGSLVISVNQRVADPSTLLKDGDEVAFLPPVSGGLGSGIYRITHGSISTEELSRELVAPADGARVVFEGVVRNHSAARRTRFLEYEAYEPMALRAMQEIGEQAKRRFPIDRVAMVHRIGRVEIGETSVAIMVTAAHRRAAFEACQYAIDELKRTVPIWKKEYFEDGWAWSEGEAQRNVYSGSLPSGDLNQQGAPLAARRTSQG